MSQYKSYTIDVGRYEMRSLRHEALLHVSDFSHRVKRAIEGSTGFVTQICVIF